MEKELNLYSEKRTSKEGKEYTAYYILIPYNNTFIKVFVSIPLYNKELVNAYYNSRKEK